MPPTNRSVARIRLRVNKHYLTETCDIQYKAAWTGPTQGAATWTTLYSDVPCRLVLQRQFARNEVIDVAGMEILGELYVLSIPIEYAIPSDGRVLVGGLYYDVINMKEQLTNDVFNIYVITRQEGIG